MTSVLAALTGTARRRRLAARLSALGRRRLPMQRLVWRQHWVALSVLLAMSAVAITAMVISESYYRSFPVAWWREDLWQSYGPQYPDLAMQAIPLVAAMFVGVQLIGRDLEGGTAGFAWTQGFGKARWVLGKLAAAAAVLVPAAVALGLVFGWWYRLYVPETGYFTFHAFALYAPALAGWTVAGLTLGMAAAAVTHREGRAMWLTLAGWIALHRFAIVGSARTPSDEFWPLQLAQLAILLAISAVLTGGTIWLIQGTPAIPGMPRLLRALPRLVGPGALALTRRLGRRRRAAVARAAWRQHRTGLLIALALLGVYVAILVITGIHIHAEPARLRPQYVDLTGPYQPGGATDANYLQALLLPFLIGAFMGGSLTGTDLDQRTVRFAWAQGVTRARWAAGQLVTVGCVLVIAAVMAGLAFQWWDQAYLGQRLADPWFALYAPVYAGWMAVAFTVAAFLGALMSSRTGAAVICLIGTLIGAVAYALVRSDHLLTAVAINRPAPPGSQFANWTIRHGQKLPNPIVNRAGLNFDSASDWIALERALTRFHATSILTYQPGSQFWQLQGMESAGLFAIALLFGAVTVWVLRRQET